MNPPDSGKEVPKARLPMVTLNLKYDRYEEDINPWRIEFLTSIYKSNLRLNWKLLLYLGNNFGIIYNNKHITNKS